MVVLALMSGLMGLVIASRLVVDASASVGARLGLSPLVVGLTIVAAGTSAPELAVVGQAVSAGDPGLAVGGIVGSNIANVLLVLGVTALFGATMLESRMVRIDIPVMIGASALTLGLSLDGGLDRLDGLALLTSLVLFVAWTLRSARSEARPTDVEAERSGPTLGNGRVIAMLAIGIVGLAGFARLVVFGAEGIAGALGVPELIIGLTVVALGTSAPEIVTSLTAAARGRRDLAIGNAVGSNIFNLLLVLGAAGLLAPAGVAVSPGLRGLDMPIMVAAALACLPLVMWDRTVSRGQGALFVAFYVAYLVFLVLDATDHDAKDGYAAVVGGFIVPLSLFTVLALSAGARRVHARQRRPVPPSATYSSEEGR